MKPSFPKLAAAGLLATLGAGLAAAPASAQPALDGVTFVNGQLFTLDGADGTATQFFPLAPGVTPDGLALYNNSLYTFDTTSGDLLQLDPTKGATLKTTSLGLTGVGPGGLAINSSGVGYLADPLTSALYQFNLAGGSAAQVGTVAVSLSSLAFDASNTLYGLGQGDGNLYDINPATPTTPDYERLIGNLGVPVGSSIGALTFAGGTLYASADDNLYTVNTTTGVGTEVNPAVDGTGFGGGFASVSGLAPAPMAAVPEPGAFGLLAAGLLPLGLLAARRRKA